MNNLTIKKENVSLMISFLIAIMHYFANNDGTFLIIYTFTVFLIYVSYVEDSLRLKLSFVLIAILLFSYERYSINYLGDIGTMTIISLDVVFLMLVIVPAFFSHHDLYNKFHVNKIYYHSPLGLDKQMVRVSQLSPLPKDFYPDFRVHGIVTLNPLTYERNVILDKEHFSLNNTNEYYIFRK